MASGLKHLHSRLAGERRCVSSCTASSQARALTALSSSKLMLPSGSRKASMVVLPAAQREAHWLLPARPVGCAACCGFALCWPALLDRQAHTLQGTDLGLLKCIVHGAFCMVECAGCRVHCAEYIIHSRQSARNTFFYIHFTHSSC